METNGIFDQMANRYDTEERIAAAGIIVKAIRGVLADTEGKTALDYGCGTGLIGLGLVDLFKSILFVDSAPQMIEQVRRKIDKGHIETAETLCADFLEAPRDIQADYIIVSQVLLHVKDTHLILARLFDAVKQGGHLILVDFDRNENIVSDKVHNGFVQEELIRLVKEVGFAAAGAHTFYHGQKIFMNQDASLFILDAKKP